MTDSTAMPHGDRPEIEAAAVTDPTSVQQIREWITAHRLEAHRGCTGFQIDQLGLGDLISVPDSDPSPRQARADGSGPWFARAGIWRS